MSQTRLAEAIGVPFRTVNRLVRGHCGVSPQMATDLAAVLGTTAKHWLDLQMEYTLSAPCPSDKGSTRLECLPPIAKAARTVTHGADKSPKGNRQSA